MNVSKKTPITGSSLVVACLLALPASAQIIFTGGGTGDWRDSANWDGSNNVKDNAGDYVIPDGFASLAMSSGNLSGGGSAVAVQGSSSATFESFKQLQNITVNFQDSSQFLVAGSGAKFGYNVIVNYGSSAISDSSGIKFALWRAADAPKEQPVINLNSGGLIVGELNYNEAGGVINLGGGDLSVASITGGAFTGGIDFSSTAASKLTLLGSTTATDLDSYITSGFITIDGSTVVDLNAFSRVVDGSGLALMLDDGIGVIPEPSFLSLLGGVFALGFVLRRRS